MAENLKLSNQLCFPIYALAKEVTNLYRPILTELDLTYPQYLVLLVLWEKDDLKVSEIGERLSLDSGTLTPLLKRLEQKQIIERKRDSDDERVVKIKLTSKGARLKENAECVPGKIMESFDISPENIGAIKKGITDVLTQITSKK